MKNRQWHTLAGNKGNLRPQHTIFFDTETRPISIGPDEEEHVLQLGWACYHRAKEEGKGRNDQWFYFTTPDEFWGYVEEHSKNNRRLYLVAHNVAFDFRIVKGFHYLSQNGWKESFTYDKGLTTILRFVRAKQSIEILSTTNFFAMSLKQLGDVVGLEKETVDFRNVTWRELGSYCHRDVEIIVKAWNLWIDFLDNHDLGTFKRTISSQAFTAYRHRFMHTPISIHSNMDVCKFERESYRGGRTECFKVGVFPEERYYYLDVNGMYAFQMANQDYPCKLSGHTSKYPLAALNNKLRNFSVIARVVVDTEEPAFVVTHNNRNVYPVGKFEAVLTTPDLRYGLDIGVIKEVKEIAWYAQAPIFKLYTGYFTGLKQRYELEGNASFRTIAKLYVNALYGKFGQTADNNKRYASVQERQGLIKRLLTRLLKCVDQGQAKHIDVNLGTLNHDTGQWTRPPGFQSEHAKRRTPEESYNSFPAIAAHVTAYARNYLWLLICKAGKRNVFYCDTDSLIVNQSGYDNLKDVIHHTKPGYLKVEKQGTTLKIYAPKDYVISDRVRQKGIRKNAVELSDGVYQQDQFLGLAGAKRAGDTDLVTIKKVVKSLKRKIKTGVVDDDGWVIPFRLPL